MMYIGTEPRSEKGVMFSAIAPGCLLRGLRWDVTVAVSGRSIHEAAVGVGRKVLTVRVAILIQALIKVQLVTFCGPMHLWRNCRRRQ